MAEMSYPLNDTWYYAEDAQLWHSTRTQGVFSSDDNLTVTALNVMKISVSSGRAWLKPSEFVNAIYANTDDLTLEIETADGYFPRYDRIVVRWDFVINSIYLAVKKGTPASSPQPPVLQRNAEAHEIAIFDILVRAGTLQIVQSDVIDKRLDENVCGIMRDGVTGIPTQALYDAWWSWFSELKLDTEQKALEFTEWMKLFKSQNEAEFQIWLGDFKSNSQAEFDEWYNSFTQTNSNIYTNWYNTFTSNSETDFNTWFSDLQDTLDSNQAANLYNKIDQHEKETTVSNPNGVHGMRVGSQGYLQAYLESGWANFIVANGYISIKRGITAGYFDSKNYTAGDFDSLMYTAGEFDNLIEMEA